MTDRKHERKPDKKVQIGKLELSKETVKELTDAEAERVEGGVGAVARGERDSIYVCGAGSP